MRDAGGLIIVLGIITSYGAVTEAAKHDVAGVTAAACLLATIIVFTAYYVLAHQWEDAP